MGRTQGPVKFGFVMMFIVSTSFLFLVVRPLLLVAMPGAPSSVLKVVNPFNQIVVSYCSHVAFKTLIRQLCFQDSPGLR